MNSKTVKDLMMPFTEYGTISEEATLFEAALALDEAQKEHEKDPRKHQTLLILNTGEEVIGKLSQLDVLRALEPKERHLEDAKSLSRFGVSRSYIKPMFNQCAFWGKPLIDICREAGSLQVGRLVHESAQHETVDEHMSLPDAIHKMAIEHHEYLLVKKGAKIVGVLEQTDLFKEVFETLSVCGI
jgi:CBS domain-containing protein